MAECRISLRLGMTEQGQKITAWCGQALIKSQKATGTGGYQQFHTYHTSSPFSFTGRHPPFAQKALHDFMPSLVHCCSTHSLSPSHCRLKRSPYALTPKTLPSPHGPAILRSTDRFDIFCCANTEDGIDR